MLDLASICSVAAPMALPRSYSGWNTDDVDADDEASALVLPSTPRVRRPRFARQLSHSPRSAAALPDAWAPAEKKMLRRAGMMLLEELHFVGLGWLVARRDRIPLANLVLWMVDVARMLYRGWLTFCVATKSSWRTSG